MNEGGFIPEMWSQHLLRVFNAALGTVRIVGVTGTLRVEKNWFNWLRGFINRV